MLEQTFNLTAAPDQGLVVGSHTLLAGMVERFRKPHLTVRGAQEPLDEGTLPQPEAKAVETGGVGAEHRSL